MDNLESDARSRLMARVRARDTRPEMIVRAIAHQLGYRFRLHDRRLPGTPDLVFPRLSAVISVNGCFWHRHPSCRKASTPSTRQAFWNEKFARNVRRDAETRRRLEADGWSVLVIWECETRESKALAERMRSFLARREQRRPRDVTRRPDDKAANLSEPPIFECQAKYTLP
jgi:DNA mismatch endonuclease (patch repair protein)